MTQSMCLYIDSGFTRKKLKHYLSGKSEFEFKKKWKECVAILLFQNNPLQCKCTNPLHWSKKRINWNVISLNCMWK